MENYGEGEGDELKRKMRTIRNKDNLVAFKGSAWQMVLPDPADHGEYQGRFVQYDAFQMFKHALAIYNFAFENPEEQRGYLRWYFDRNDCTRSIRLRAWH